MSHRCPVTGCTVTVADDRRLMCRMDWALVPKPLQAAVNHAWDHGRGTGSAALLPAQKAAIAAAGRARGPQAT